MPQTNDGKEMRNMVTVTVLLLLLNIACVVRRTPKHGLASLCSSACMRTYVHAFRRFKPSKRSRPHFVIRRRSGVPGTTNCSACLPRRPTLLLLDIDIEAHCVAAERSIARHRTSLEKKKKKPELHSIESPSERQLLLRLKIAF